MWNETGSPPPPPGHYHHHHPHPHPHQHHHRPRGGRHRRTVSGGDAGAVAPRRRHRHHGLPASVGRRGRRGPATAPHHHASPLPGAVPFHYLISEQAKSLAALQELQHEVGALLEFRDLVMETFPNLRTKLLGDDGSREDIGGEHRRGSGTDPGQGHHSSNIPVSIRTGEWTPGIRVRKKISSNSKDENRSSKKSDAVQDSGFSTEASSKETHSASSTAPAPSSAPGAVETDEVEDELFHLLDIIHRKGTRLKDEAEALHGQLRCSAYSIGPAHHSADGPMGGTDGVTAFERHLFRPASAEDVRLLRRERDMLLDRLAEAEAEAVAGRARAARLREDLDSLMAAKVDLEEQLRAVVTQRGEVNSRIHDLHLQFVTKGGGAITSTPVGSAPSSPDGPSATAPPKYPTVDVTGHAPGLQRRRQGGGATELDAALGDVVPRTRSVDSRKVAAILRERDWLGLQRHLLASTVRNQVLQEKLDTAVNLELSLRDKLNKYREENEDLKFQLEDKNIELEGTRARLRLLEELHQPSSKTITSPDIIPVSESSTTDHPILSRSEITTASMKAMSPLPLMDQHSSSTESAHDHAEKERKRKPSKIPLKSYTAPKPPGGKRSPSQSAAAATPGPRSRSGDRPHSAQSWRHARAGPAHSDTSTSLPKSRNGSLGPVRDSLSGKLRSADSLSRAAQAQAQSATTQAAEKTPERACAKADTPSPWNLCSYSSDPELAYPDSLDKNTSSERTSTTQSATDTSRFQTANTFLWNAGAVGGTGGRYYDSIDSNVGSGVFHQHGEELAECDSLEKRLSGSDWSSDQK